MKKIFISTMAVFTFLYSKSLVFASPYVPLVTIPGLTDQLGGDTGSDNISKYLSALYNFGVSAAAGLAVIMVIWGGIEYITAISGEGKSGGKERISSAILGLLLALGSYIILKTINSDLLSTSFKFEPLNIQTNAGGTANPLNPLGVYSLPDNPFGGFGGGLGTTGSGVPDFSALNSVPNASGQDVLFTSYGYQGDFSPDQNSANGIGNNNNKLVAGSSIALSPDLISSLNPVHGAAVYVNGVKVGYYDDSTASSYQGNPLTNRVDVYDPTASLGGNNFSKKVTGNVTIDNNDVRTQTPAK